MNPIPITKTEGQELPVPNAWRPALKLLADAVVLKSSVQTIDGFIVDAIDEELLLISHSNVNDYPDSLGPLSAASWTSSICVWHEGYWQVLLDLTTDTGEVSDLVLHAKVTECGDAYTIEPGLIYVP